jgi:hypothetical protein
MKTKILGYLLGALNYLVFKILLFDLVTAYRGAGSRSRSGGRSRITAFSERLVLTGLAIAMVAGLLVFSQTSGGRNFGVPGQFIGSVHAQSMIDFNIEVRAGDRNPAWASSRACS